MQTVEKKIGGHPTVYCPRALPPKLFFDCHKQLRYECFCYKTQCANESEC